MKNQLTLLLFAFLCAYFFVSPCFASYFAKVLREVGKVGENVPIRPVEKIVGEASTSKAAREAVEEGLSKTGRRLDDAAYNRQLIKTLESTLGTSVDPATLKAIRQMDRPMQEAILVLSRGVKNVEKSVPDIAMRSDFLKNASGETLSVLGREPSFMRNAVDIQTLTKSGKMLSPPHVRPATLDDFGNFFKKYGDKGMTFWKTKIQPHWKLWVGGAALTAILVAPEEYLDSACEITKEGMKKIARFGGNMLVSALEGMAEAPRQIVEKTAKSLWKSFFSDIWGVVTFALLLVIAAYFVFRFSIVKSFFSKWRRARKPASEDP